MPITRTPINDDDGTRTTGTALNNAWKQELYDQIDAAGGVQSVGAARTDTGAVNNWAAVTGNGYIPWNGAADAIISGLAGGVAGQIVFVKNITATKVAYFLHASGLSSAANQFSNFATSGTTGTPIAPGGVLAYLHNGTNWQLIFHEQGAWITPTYAAGNFTASAGTWTVDSGDVITYASVLNGRRLTVSWWLNTTTTGAGMGSDLRIAIPGGFTSAKDLTIPAQTGDNNVSAIGLAIVASGGGTFIILRLVNSAAWTSSVTNLTFVRGELTIEVN